jgi:hypothetical protein
MSDAAFGFTVSWIVVGLIGGLATAAAKAFAPGPWIGWAWAVMLVVFILTLLYAGKIIISGYLASRSLAKQIAALRSDRRTLEDAATKAGSILNEAIEANGGPIRASHYCPECGLS